MGISDWDQHYIVLIDFTGPKHTYYIHVCIIVIVGVVEHNTGGGHLGRQLEICKSTNARDIIIV